jgi:hypothetical protein
VSRSVRLLSLIDVILPPLPLEKGIGGTSTISITQLCREFATPLIYIHQTSLCKNTLQQNFVSCAHTTSLASPTVSVVKYLVMLEDNALPLALAR